MTSAPITAPPTPSSFADGVRTAAPIVLGYVPIAFAFGVLGRTSGFSVAEVGLMSCLVYAGASQFIGTSMFASWAAAPAIISTTFLVNLRHLLMSTALVPSMRRIPIRHNTWLAHFITDESFAVVTSVLQGRPASVAFLAGVQVTPHVTWILFSMIGAGAGQLVGNTQALGLDFALPAMFVGLLMPHLHGEGHRPRLIGALVAALVTVLVALFFPGSGWSVITAAVIGATVGVMLQ